MKRIPILPTLVTLGNAFCGFLAIGYALKAQANPDPAQFDYWIEWSGWMILLAMVFDALDGKVARMAKRTSDFGAELDSLCDVISFGVAPALIVKVLAQRQEFFPRVSWVTSALFVMCAALRLARFNVETVDESDESHMYFTGLPTPAAAGFVAAMTIMVYDLRQRGDEFAGLAKALEPAMDGLLYAMPFVAVVLALLMISHVRYAHLLSRLHRARKPLDYFVKLALVVTVAVLAWPFSAPILIAGYVLSGPVCWLKEHLFARVPAKAGDRASPEG